MTDLAEDKLLCGDESCLHCQIINVINRRAKAIRAGGTTMPAGDVVIALTNALADVLALHAPLDAESLRSQIAEHLPQLELEQRLRLAHANRSVSRH